MIMKEVFSWKDQVSDDTIAMITKFETVEEVRDFIVEAMKKLVEANLIWFNHHLIFLFR